MDGDHYRFSLSAEKYLEGHHVLTYMEDAVVQLLEHREENPKVNPTKFFSDYFTSVKGGNHTLFREYAYISATPHNRASFIRTFWKCFRNIGKKGDLLSTKEYHSLVTLLCSNFPFEPVQKTAKIILMDDAMDCLISFSDFLYAFQLQFCYDDFLVRCEEAFKTVQGTPHGQHDTVIVPTSETAENDSSASQHQTKQPALSKDVDAGQFFRTLIPVCERLEYSSPPLTVLRQITSSAQRLTFYGFLMALTKSESLNKHIGMLPNKAELLEISDPELTSPTIRPSSAAKLHPVSAHSGLVSNTGNSHAQEQEHRTPRTLSRALPKIANRPGRKAIAHRKTKVVSESGSGSQSESDNVAVDKQSKKDEEEEDEEENEESEGSGSSTN